MRGWMVKNNVIPVTVNYNFAYLTVYTVKLTKKHK